MLVHLIPVLFASLTCEDVKSAYSEAQCCGCSSNEGGCANTEISVQTAASVCSSQPGPSIFRDLTLPFDVDSDASLDDDVFDVLPDTVDPSTYANLRMFESFAALYNKSTLRSDFVDEFMNPAKDSFTKSLSEAEHRLLTNLDSFYDLSGDLTGTTAVIFGGTRGYGQSVAVALATMGASVTVTGRSAVNWDMSKRMMTMNTTELQRHCVDADATSDTVTLVKSDYTLDDGSAVPDGIWDVISRNRTLPQECDPGYYGPLHVPQEVVDRITYVPSDVRILAQVKEVLQTLPGGKPDIVANFACATGLMTSTLQTAEYNALSVLRNFQTPLREYGMMFDFMKATLQNDTKIIELNPTQMHTRFNFQSFLVDSFHLTTVKGTHNIWDAMDDVFPGGNPYTFAEGSSATQLGFGWSQRSKTYFGTNLANYMISKKVSQQLLWSEMQYPGKKHIVHSYAPSMKTHAGLSAFNYQFATGGPDGWDKWVIYLREKNGGRAKAFLPTNHQNTFITIHAYMAYTGEVFSSLPSSYYYGKFKAKAIFDAHSGQRSLSRLFPLTSTMPIAGGTDHFYDYMTGIISLVGAEFETNVKSALAKAWANNRVWKAFNTAMLYIGSGTLDVGVAGVKLELVERRAHST